MCIGPGVWVPRVLFWPVTHSCVFVRRLVSGSNQHETAETLSSCRRGFGFLDFGFHFLSDCAFRCPQVMSRAACARPPTAGWTAFATFGVASGDGMHRARVPTRFRSRRVPCNSAPRVGEKLVSHSKGGGDETATTATRNSPVVRSKLTRAKETHPVPNNGHGRVMCYRCRRVERLCVCGLVRDIVGSDDKIFTKMHVTVLQDRIEALSRPFGSAIVCELALENCTSVWYDTKVPENVPRPKHLPTENVGVLFPGPHARRLRRTNEKKTEKNNHEKTVTDPQPTHLIVIDTTWHRARRMYERIPWIKDLPSYVLGDSTMLISIGDGLLGIEKKTSREDEKSGDGPNESIDSLIRESTESGDETNPARTTSGYRIRKQPKPGFLSTAECVAGALREGEPDDEIGEDDETGDERIGDDDETETEKPSSGAVRGGFAAAAVEACFDAMIDAQINSFSGRKNVRYRSRKLERAVKEKEAFAAGEGRTAE